MAVRKSPMAKLTLEKQRLQEELIKIKSRLKELDNASRSVLGRNMVYWRKQRGITQQELADRLGQSRPSLANIERGKNNTPVNTLLRICEVLNVTPNDLLLGR
jgi:DNA-binding XRE family transcriptional regulator